VAPLEPICHTHLDALGPSDPDLLGVASAHLSLHPDFHLRIFLYLNLYGMPMLDLLGGWVS
jgi:hypothetical protein